MSKLSEERFLKERGGDMAYVANTQKILNFDIWVVFVDMNPDIKELSNAMCLCLALLTRHSVDKAGEAGADLHFPENNFMGLCCNE